MSAMKSNNRGSTMIELLVVIAIISLLSTIALASVKVTLNKSRDAARAEQIRNIITAFNLYSLDHGTYPGKDVGLTQASGTNYCLGLKTGEACWEQGNATPGYHTKALDGNGYAAAYGDDALYNAMLPYVKSPHDPFVTKPNYGDYYIYSPISDTNHQLGWIVETCTPDVVPAGVGGAYAVKSPGTCMGGMIMKQGLWYGQGCQYSCSLRLEDVGI